MTELSPRTRSTAVGSLVSSRAVYAYNWYDVGPIQLAIASGLSVAFGDLSLALWTFLLGVAAFQIPAGTFALRWGARRTTLCGAAVLTAGALASAAAPHFDEFLVARFVVGVGAALFFSPGIGLIARYYPRSGRGWGIGLFNGAFSIGAAIALYASVVLEQDWGWRASLLTAGVAMLAVSVENFVVLPRLPEPAVPVREALGRTREIASSRYLWCLALALVGFWASNFLAAQYIVPWVVAVHGWAEDPAGVLGAVLIACPFLGAPLGGHLTQRSARPRLLLASATALTGLGFAAFPFLPSDALWPLVVLDGVASGMGTGGLYYLGSLRARERGEDLPLSVGLINFLQVICGAFIVLVIGFVFFGPETVLQDTEGWLLMAALTIGLLPFLALIGDTPRPEGSRSPNPA